jgi:hypothetical protein
MFKLKISNWKSAILETFLIVIGITIAFGLENWNNERLLKIEEVELLEEFNKTLQSDLEDIQTNISAYSTCINSIKQIRKAFDENLPFHDSMVFHFSAITYNMIFYRNDGPYEVLKSKGFDLISDDSLRYMLSDLYSVEYRIIDNIEEQAPQFLSYPHIFDYMKENFRKSEQENFDSDWLVSIEPLDYEWIKKDPQFRLLIEHTAFWKGKTILMYERTRRKIEAVQERIQSEIINQ